MIKIDFLGVFNRVVDIVFAVIMCVITAGIIIGVYGLIMDIVGLMIRHQLASDYLQIISDVLTLFIMLELLRSLVEYFYAKRLRMTFIVDAAIVFVLRETMIGLFEHKLLVEEVYAMSVLLLVLTVLRIGSIVMYQRDARSALKAGLD